MRPLVLLLALLSGACTFVDGLTVRQTRNAALISVGLDLATSQAAINSGLSEGGLVRGSQPVLANAALSGALMGGLYFLEPYNARAAKGAYLFLAAARGAFAVHNVVEILSNDRSPEKKKRLAPMVSVRVAF